MGNYKNQEEQRRKEYKAHIKAEKQRKREQALKGISERDVKFEKAFVLGNGQTRLELDLNELTDKGKVFGCNNLYKDYTPDVLVATDKPIAYRIQKSGYSKEHVFYTREPLQLHGGHKIMKNWGYSSGPVALTLAAIDQIPHIYMIGMDLQGIRNNDKKNPAKRTFNNIYAGMEYYKHKDAEETHFVNWYQQIEQIMKEYQYQKFYHVNPHNGYTPQEWLDCPNFRTMTLEQFRNCINTL